MKVSLGQAAQIIEQVKASLDLNLPASVGYELSLFGKLISPHLLSLDEQKMTLAKKYGEKTEQGFSFSSEASELFNAEYLPLLNKEVDVDVTPIPIADLKASELPLKFYLICEPLLTK